MSFLSSAVLSILVGAVLWSSANFYGGKLEPWDNANFGVFYFIACVFSFGLGAICRDRAWATGALVVFSMLPVMVIFNPETGPYLLIGLFFLGILSLPAIVSSIIGSAIRTQLTKEKH
ncbi:MAG: hypothetical protein AAFQ34_05905 [Pseudomonadota bacterium]